MQPGQPSGPRDGDDGEQSGGDGAQRDGGGAQSDGGAQRFCYRHPDRPSNITCTRCERPICPDCMITASVGFQCPECVRTGSGTGHSPAANTPRTVAGGVIRGDGTLVTKVLLGLNVAVFLAILAVGSRLTSDLVMLGQWPPAPYAGSEGVAEGQWWRLLTAVFAHEEIWHIAMNMLALWFLGGPLERVLGRSRFLALYLLAGLGGNALAYVVAAPDQPSLGASGAIYGLFGAMAVLARRMRYDLRPILVLLAINLVFTFTMPGIAWEAHVGGLVVGAGVAYGMVAAPRERRALVQWGTCAAALVVIGAVCATRTLMLGG